MKILYLAHRIPYPPNKGDKIRAYHQIRHLAVRHDVHLYTLVDEDEDWLWVPELERTCARVRAFPLTPWAAMARAGTALLQGRAFSPAYFRTPEIARAVREDLAAGGFDAVVVFCSAMMDLVPADCDLPVLADYCDLDSAKWTAYARQAAFPMNLVHGTEGRRLARYEVASARRARAVAFATPLEGDDFSVLPGSSGIPVEIVPNGVDHSAFSRGNHPRAPEPTVIFTGAMDYRPNYEGALWYIERVWQRVLETLPNARLQIVGRSPHPTLRAHHGRHQIEVTGTVPEVQPWLHAAWISVAPLHIARGVQNKVLEAMAAGVPTLISPAVSRGLEARTGIETLVVEGEDAWAANTTRLLQAPAVRAGLAEAGLRYVRAHHDWDVHGEAWGRMLERAVADSRQMVAA